MNSFTVDDFITTNITFRNESMLFDDLSHNEEKLKHSINEKFALVIGGSSRIL